MNGIFVILSTVCFTTGHFNQQLDRAELDEKCVVNFVRISISSTCISGEVAKPICEWVGHSWTHVNPNCHESLNGVRICSEPQWREQYDQCDYCGRKRFDRLKQREEHEWVYE